MRQSRGYSGTDKLRQTRINARGLDSLSARYKKIPLSRVFLYLIERAGFRVLAAKGRNQGWFWTVPLFPPYSLGRYAVRSAVLGDSATIHTFTSDQKNLAKPLRSFHRFPFCEKSAIPFPLSASATCQAPFTAPLSPAESISNP